MSAVRSLRAAALKRSGKGPRGDHPVVKRGAALTISQEAVGIVRSMYAAFSRLAHGGEIAAYVAEYYDPDARYEPVEETGIIRGHDAIIRWNERWLEAWEEAWDEIDEIIKVGEMVVASITTHGRGRKSGMEIGQREFDVFELRDGKILRMREYLDPHQALEAAELTEQAISHA